MSFIPSLLRVLTGAIVLLGVSLFLNISGDTENSEALLAMGAQAKEKCINVDGKRFCRDDDNDDQDDRPKNKKKSGNICEGDNHCGAGYTDLETPNKYKACCQPNDASQTAPKEAEKCKFPGEVGTPPNCTCPPGTEFMGYRGCLPKKADPVGPSPKKLDQ